MTDQTNFFWEFNFPAFESIFEDFFDYDLNILNGDQGDSTTIAIILAVGLLVAIMVFGLI